MQIIILVAFFHLFPAFIFFIADKSAKKSSQRLFILGLLFISFLSDLIGLRFASLGFNTNLISNWYLIISRILETAILVFPFSLTKSKRVFLILSIALMTFFHLGFCLVFGFSKQNDYLNIISRTFILILSFISFFYLFRKTNSNTFELETSMIPALAILIYTSAMFIPQMIINIDDYFEFPILFQQIRFWVAVGSNIIRDSLFALFFFQAKKMNYDTGK